MRVHFFFATLLFCNTCLAQSYRTVNTPLYWEEIPINITAINALGMAKNGNTLILLNPQGSYESVDSGKSWQLRETYDDYISNISSNGGIIIANFGKTIVQGSLTQSGQSTSAVRLFTGSGRSNTMHSAYSNCGWHSGTCHSVHFSRLIGDSLWTTAESWSGYRQEGRSEFYLNGSRDFRNLYGFIGNVGSSEYFWNGDALKSNTDSIPLPEPSIRTISIFHRGKSWFILKSNHTIWTKRDTTDWVQMVVPDGQALDLKQYKDEFAVKTPTGWYKMHINRPNQWQPLYLNNISLPETLDNLYFWGSWVTAVQNGLLYRSFNGGQTWDKITVKGLPTVSISDIRKGLNNSILLGYGYGNNYIYMDSTGTLHPDSITTRQGSIALPELQTVNNITIQSYVWNFPTFFYSFDTGRVWMDNRNIPYTFPIGGWDHNYMGVGTFFIAGNSVFTVGSTSGKLFRTSLRRLQQNCENAVVHHSATFDCLNPYLFFGDTIRNAGTYNKFVAHPVCDTLHQLTFQRPTQSGGFPDTTIVVPLTVCRGRPVQFNGNLYLLNNDTTIRQTSPTGCEIDYQLKINFRTCRQVGVHGAISPNPTTGHVLVEFNAAIATTGMITISDMMGQIVVENGFNVVVGLNAVPIDITHLPRGQYFIRIISENQQKIFRIMKI